MGRKATPQKRLGKNEQGKYNKALGIIRNYKLFWRYKNKGETWHNSQLIGSLLQADVDIMHNSIPIAQFLGEKFRCEAFIEGGAFPLLAIECKKAVDGNIKAVWKEGLSQALLYSQNYKRVILIFYDFTKNGAIKRAFSPGNKRETTLAKDIHEKHGIKVVVLRPTKN